jgi:hypothetical protein
VVYKGHQDSGNVNHLYTAVVPVDSDGDGVHTFCDLCPADPDPGQEDFDADGLGNACDADDDNDGRLDAADCHDTDPLVWAMPGEAANLTFAADSQTLAWSAPPDPGAVVVAYDMLRSSDRTDFVTAAVCVETDGSDTSSVDGAVPPPGTAFYYLARAGNACGEGSLGSGSSGLPRQGLACP